MSQQPDTDTIVIGNNLADKAIQDHQSSSADFQSALDAAMREPDPYLNQKPQPKQDEPQDQDEPQPQQQKAQAKSTAKTQQTTKTQTTTKPSEGLDGLPEPSDLIQQTNDDADKAQEDDPEFEKQFPKDLFTGKGKNHWQNLRENNKALRKEIAALKSSKPVEPQIADVRQSKEYQELLKANQDTLSRLEAVAIERSPRFQAQFQPRIDAAMQLAIDQVDPSISSQVKELLSMPAGKQRNQALSAIYNDLTGIEQGQFISAVGELAKIEREKSALAARAPEVWKQWQQEAESQQIQKHKAQQDMAEKAFTDEARKWEGISTFKTPEKAALAKKIYSGGMDLTQLAKAAHWAVHGSELMKTVQQVMQENNELKSKIASMQNGEPGGSDASDSDVSEDTNLNYMDAITRKVQQSGLLR